MFCRWQHELFETTRLSSETDRKGKPIEAANDRQIDQLKNQAATEKRGAR